MARSRSERRHNEEKKYNKRLKEELSLSYEIRDDKGRVVTKPTVKDLKNIKRLKNKKNHSKSCSCAICKKARYDRSEQKKIYNSSIKRKDED